MVLRAIFRAFVCLSIVFAAGFVVSGCGGGSSGSKSSGSLYLKRFLLVDGNLDNLGGTGTTNAFRDTRLLFEFSGPVDLKSIDSRTIRIGIPTGNNLWLEAPGRFRYVTIPQPNQGPIKVVRNKILFEPTYSKHNVGDTADNPFGLNAYSFYEVIVPSQADQGSFVTDTDGKGIVKSFYASFETSDEYQQNLSQPTLIETIPRDGQIDVEASADVVLRFTEPMKPDSFRMNQTVFVRNLSINRAVLGSLRFSTDAKTVVFRPVFGYGKGPSTIFVRVTTSVTNLPGNPIPKEIAVTFVSVYDPDQFNQGDVQETFDDRAYEDTGFENQHPLADWHSGVTQGFLAGSFTVGTVTLSKGSNTYATPPWGWGASFAARTQMMHVSGEVGSARTITGFEWYKICNNSSTATNVTINMGHTQSGGLTTTFASNYSDTPVTCVNNVASYPITNTIRQAWTAGPTFTTNFQYNGNDNVILEVFCTCGGASNNWTGYWRTPASGSVQLTAYTRAPWAGAPAVSTSNWHMDTRYTYLIDQSEAQSHWYDMGIRSPQFLDVFLEPDLSSQPAGTSSEFKFQGTTEDLNVGGVPDLTNVTQWVDDLEQLTGLKYIRFHVDFKSNQSTNTRPMFDSVIFPFVWK